MDWIKTLSITASNDINEETLYSLAQQVFNNDFLHTGLLLCYMYIRTQFDLFDTRLKQVYSCNFNLNQNNQS